MSKRLAALHMPWSTIHNLGEICEMCTACSSVIEPQPPHDILMDFTQGCLSDLLQLQKNGSASEQKRVFIGVANNRWVARCAAMQLTISPLIIAAADNKDFLAPLSLAFLKQSQIPNAAKLVDQLYDLGLHTFGELAAVSHKDLFTQFGIEQGVLLGQHAIGKTDDDIRPLYPPPQIIVTFQVPADSPGIKDTQITTTLLRYLSSELANKLQQQNWAAQQLHLEIGWQKQICKHSVSLVKPISGADPLYRAALRLWNFIDPVAPVLVIHLHADNLIPCQPEQIPIFESNFGGQDQLAKLIQSTQNRFGKNSLQKANQLPLTRRELIRSMWKKLNL